MTTVTLKDKTLVYQTIDTQAFHCPMSLDTLTQIVDVSDQSRVILFARHGFHAPANIRGILKGYKPCGM